MTSNAPERRPTMSVRVVALLDRTSDRTVLGSQGAEALARGLAKRAGTKPTLQGTPGQARESRWEDDLEQATASLQASGDTLHGILSSGGYPVLLASDCTIAMGTLPALAAVRPDAWVLWVDAHGDFNSPDTTLSGFLGGMCLAGACGVWETGLGTGPEPSQIVICGARDLDPDERNLLDVSAVAVLDPADAVARLRGRPVFIHLDLDVLDPSVLPGASFPVAEGMEEEELAALLRDLMTEADVIGCEITAFTAPELAGRIADVVKPLVGR